MSLGFKEAAVNWELCSRLCKQQHVCVVKHFIFITYCYLQDLFSQPCFTLKLPLLGDMTSMLQTGQSTEPISSTACWHNHCNLEQIVSTGACFSQHLALLRVRQAQVMDACQIVFHPAGSGLDVNANSYCHYTSLTYVSGPSGKE